jgi:flagellar basal body-associated protein FliL
MKLNQSQRSGGACGKGCVMFLVFAVLLLVALAGGTYWGIKRFQSTYSAAEPMTFPEGTIAWQQGSAEEVETDNTAEQLESAQAQPAEPAEYVETVAADPQLRWKAFEKAADKHQKARIHLSADEINTLLNNDPDTRGKAHVAIRDNVGYVSVSIPLDNLLKNAGWAQSILGTQGRFLNAQATVKASPDGDPAKAQIANVKIGNEPVSDEWLDRQIFGMKSARMAISDWLADQEIQSFQIRHNRVYAETRGP